MPEPKIRLRMKKIDRVAFVDRGDNPTADVLVWKRAPEVEKALSFAEARAKMQAENATWDHTNVLHSVMRSIMEDDEMEPAAKTALLEQSIDEFATEMKGAMPAMMKQDKGPLARLVSAIGKRLNWTDEEVGQITEELGDEMPETTFDPKALPAEAQAAFDELTKRAETAEAKVAELAPEPVEKTDPDIPEAVAKRMETLEKQAQDARDEVAKIRLEQRTAEYVEKAKGYAHLPVKPEAFGTILRKIADGEKLTAEEQTEHERVLSAASEASRVGKLFEEIGSGGDADSSATAKVNKLAAEKRTANPALTETQARAEVYKENPALMGEVEDEDRQRAAARR